MARRARMPNNPLEEDLGESQPEFDSVLGGGQNESVVSSESEDGTAEETSTRAREDRASQASRALKRRVLAASGAGLIPSPLIDLAAITSIQLELIKALADIYGIQYRQSLGKSLLASLAGGILPILTASALGSFFKAMPIVGIPAGALSVSAMGAATTYAVGRVFIMHFESGGTLLDFNPEAMRVHFRREYTEATNSDLVAP